MFIFDPALCPCRKSKSFDQKTSFCTEASPFSVVTSFKLSSTSICTALPRGNRAEPYGGSAKSWFTPFWYQKATLEKKSPRSSKPERAVPSELYVQPKCSIPTRN